VCSQASMYSLHTKEHILMPRPKQKVKPLYVELTAEDRSHLEHLAKESGDASGFRVTLSDIIRQLVREAVKRGTPIRLGQ
jgi:hypothetical protein